MLAAAGIFGVFFFLTYCMQLTLGFSPLTTGLAFLPMTSLLVLTSATVQTRVLPRTGVKPLVITGMALGMVSMFLFTRLTPGSGYATHVLPGLLVIGVGMGCIFAPAIGTATLGVDLHETGVASAMVNTSQQVGGSVGLALLSTLSASAATHFALSHARLGPLLPAAAAVHGYTTAFWWAAGIFAVGLLLSMIVLPGKVKTGQCSVMAALARGVHYAHHVETAEVATVVSPLQRAAGSHSPSGPAVLAPCRSAARSPARRLSGDARPSAGQQSRSARYG